MADQEITEKRTAERRIVKTEVTFHTEDDIYMANSVDISDMGAFCNIAKRIPSNE